MDLSFRWDTEGWHHQKQQAADSNAFIPARACFELLGNRWPVALEKALIELEGRNPNLA